MPKTEVATGTQQTETKRYIGLTERGRKQLPDLVAELNSELKPETVKVMRDAIKKSLGEQASDHYSI